MKTVGNDLVRHQLHENRKWYLGLGVLVQTWSYILLEKEKVTRFDKGVEILIKKR